MRLAAGLRPDPLGKLERSPDHLAAIGGGCLLLKGREGKGMARGKGGRGGKGRTPVPDCQSLKVATLKCGGPPTMPEENGAPGQKSLKTAESVYSVSDVELWRLPAYRPTSILGEFQP